MVHVVFLVNLDTPIYAVKFIKYIEEGPCHYSMMHTQIVSGGDNIQIWKVATKTMNKQLWKTNKGWFSSFRVGSGG
jgi:hypothetical protein